MPFIMIFNLKIFYKISQFNHNITKITWLICTLNSNINYLRRLRSTLFKIRSNSFPENPREVDFAIPPQYRLTDDDKDFLILDETSEETGRILIFSSAEQLKIMSKSEVLHMDGTFKTCPQMFSQLYIIIAKHRRNTFRSLLY